MERERLKTLFWPFTRGWFNGYYRRFEQRAQSLERSALEGGLQSPTYRHQLRDMLVRFGVLGAAALGISQLIQPTPEPTPLHILYLVSLGPQYCAVILPSVTRSIMIQTEQKILQQELTRR